MSDIHVIRNQQAVKNRKQQELINKLSELTIPFPIKSVCSACECAWEIPDLAHMERVWSEYHLEWVVGFCCPTCYKTNVAFKERDLDEFYLLKEEDGDEFYESQRRFQRYKTELRSLRNLFKKAPLWMVIYRWMRHIDWKIQNREKPVYLNDRRFKASVDITRIDTIELKSENESGVVNLSS